jgi:glycosyltransferase involved in cell wall biosynthesis
VFITNVGGIGDLLTHKMTGYLVEPTVQDIYSGLVEVVDDKENWSGISERAFFHLHENFSNDGQEERTYTTV